MAVTKLKKLLIKHLLLIPLILVSITFSIAALSGSNNHQALNTCNSNNLCFNSGIQLTNGCGSGDGHVNTSINFGCYGNSCSTSGGPAPYCTDKSGAVNNHSGITDLLFAIIRFLSDGVGLAIVLSVTIGGIQYIVSRGEPSGTQAAVRRLTSSVVALLLFIFGYAILNYVIPGVFFKQ